MSTTKIHHRKHEPGTPTRAAGPGSRRTRVIAAVIVALAVVAAGLAAAALLAGTGDDGPATPGQAPTRDEQIAANFLGAYTSFRPDLVAQQLADDASMPDAWWRDLKRYEALGMVFLVRPCEQVGASAVGTSIMCTFDYHALSSDAEGRAPFGDNTFALRVDDGKVDHFEVTDNGGAINGFEQRYDAFGSWARVNHPADWKFMDSFETVSAEDLPRWLQLWKVRLEQYANRISSYVGATQGP